MNPVIKREEEMFGYVLFLDYSPSSRSEGTRPYLVRKDASIYQLHYVNDNEFTNQSLFPLHGKYCRIRGEFLPQHAFVEVREIAELPDPHKQNSSV